jgi:hypothetical protein
MKIIKRIQDFCYKWKWFVVTFLLIALLGGIYFGFYWRYYLVNRIIHAQVVCNLGDVWEGFMNFMEKEHRWPICMDEVMAAPYNRNLLHQEHTCDLFSGLPFRCVTLRNYYVKGNPQCKALVTLYQPYRTQLWPYGEYETIVMLSNGTICTVSPDELEEIIPKEKEEKNNENWLEELMKKAKER